MITKPTFELSLSNLFWLEGVDESEDLCAHGHVFVKIGDEIVADDNVTASAAALYLLRTLKNNYKKGDFGNPLLPCCGHFMIAEGLQDTVYITGCSNGDDWNIIHINEHKVKHLSKNGQEAITDKESYKEMVLAFADQVERFYMTSKPKMLPQDEVERKGYLTFWKEWRRLRDEWKQPVFSIKSNNK